MTINEYWTEEILNGLNGFDIETNRKHVSEVLRRCMPAETPQSNEKQEKFQQYIDEVAKHRSTNPHIKEGETIQGLNFNIGIAKNSTYTAVTHEFRYRTPEEQDYIVKKWPPMYNSLHSTNMGQYPPKQHLELKDTEQEEHPIHFHYRNLNTDMKTEGIKSLIKGYEKAAKEKEVTQEIEIETPLLFDIWLGLKHLVISIKQKFRK